MNIDKMCEDAMEAIQHSIGISVAYHNLKLRTEFHAARIRLGLAVPVARSVRPKLPEKPAGGPGGAVKFHTGGVYVGSGHFDNSYMFYRATIGGGGGGSGYGCGGSGSDSGSSSDCSSSSGD